MEDAKGVILNLAGLIEYHRGSIVSREIIKGETGNVTLFAFDDDEELSEHTSPYDAMVQILDGRAAIVISGNSLILEEGQSVIMPANQPHSLRALTKFKMLLTMIKS